MSAPRPRPWCRQSRDDARASDATAGVDRSRLPSPHQLEPQGRGIDPAQLDRHRSPFDDAVTARAETLRA